MKSFKIFLIAFLFSIPKVEFFGLNSNTILIILLSVFLFKNFQTINKAFLRLNLPYLFLIVFTLITQIFFFQTNNEIETRFVIAKNLELLAELLLIYFLIFQYKDKRKIKNNLMFFLEIYFNLNIIYLFIVLVYPSSFYIFHPDLEVSSREMLLGYEPSYTVSLTTIFFLMYFYLSDKKKNILMYFILTAYTVIFGESKTMWFIFGVFGLYYILEKHLKLRKKIKYLTPIIMFTFLVFGSLILNQIEIFYEINDVYKLSKIEQYEQISKITRFEAIKKSLDLFFSQPFGFGYGNSIIELSNYMKSSDLKSFEISEANFTANTPKSQFLEFLISGGVCFILLFIKKLKFLFRVISVKNKYIYLFIPISITFFFIERLPSVLLFSILYIIPILNNEKIKYEK